MRKLSFAISILVVLAVVGIWLSCGHDTAIMSDDYPVEGNEGAALFEWAIGPIDGITTAWHPAPQEITVPVGTTIRLKCGASASSTVAWSNAVEISLGTFGSIAECHVTTPGRHEISAVAQTSGANEGGNKRDGGGIRETSTSHSCVVIGVEAGVDRIGVTALAPRVTPLFLTESSSNYETMRAFLTGGEHNQEISQLRRVEPGHYRTAVNRRVALGAALIDPRFATLIETRVSGERPALGVETIYLKNPGRHSVSVGPPAAAANIVIETYRVTITSHKKGTDFVTDGAPVTFLAQTDPPGYEDDITWISSTKYGEAHPVIGHGKSFNVEFKSASSQRDSWLGVRADNATFTQDTGGASCLPWAFLYDGQDHRFAATPGNHVFYASTTNVDTVTVVAQNALFQDIVGSSTTLYPGTKIVINYPSATYYALRLQDKPNPKPTGTGTHGLGDVPQAACPNPDKDFNCDNTVYTAIKTIAGGTHTVRVSARNSNGPSDCPVEVTYKVGATTEAFVVGPGQSSGVTVSSAANVLVHITYKCTQSANNKCRVTLTMEKTGAATDFALANENWRPLTCNTVDEFVIHTGKAPGTYKLSVAGSSGGQASDCAASISCKVDGTTSAGPIAIPAGGPATSLEWINPTGKTITFHVTCDQNSTQNCRLTVTKISNP